MSQIHTAALLASIGLVIITTTIYIFITNKHKAERKAERQIYTSEMARLLERNRESITNSEIIIQQQSHELENQLKDSKSEHGIEIAQAATSARHQGFQEAKTHYKKIIELEKSKSFKQGRDQTVAALQLEQQSNDRIRIDEPTANAIIKRMILGDTNDIVIARKIIEQIKSLHLQSNAIDLLTTCQACGSTMHPPDYDCRCRH